MGHATEQPGRVLDMAMLQSGLDDCFQWYSCLANAIVVHQSQEGFDAQLSATDDDGRPAMFGKVAVVAVVGNEDGAHKIVADMFQGLNDIGFTIPAQGCTYWNNEAMNPVDYKDLDSTPSAVASTITTLSSNAVHLARFLRSEQYPAV